MNTPQKNLHHGILVCALSASLALSACGGSGATSGPSAAPSATSPNNSSAAPPAVIAGWTWEGGSDTANAAGAYGTQGVPAATNVPGARSGAAQWMEAGNLWIFGGIGPNASGTPVYLNDLWMYDHATAEWTWVGGADTSGASGVYGTEGTASVTNVPGARDSTAFWEDASGNFWLFGGGGADSTGTQGDLNDLWEFSPVTQEWTWEGGSNTVGASGVYGTEGQPAATNIPGARAAAASTTDASGDLWIFGGDGYDSSGTQGFLNDLWMFNPATREWTWESGSSDATNVAGVYGTQGQPAAANVPGSRTGASMWADASGNLWLFGGDINDSQNLISGSINDLWMFNPATREWTWEGGDDGLNAGNDTGTYGTQGVAAPTNLPGGRLNSAAWVDASGNLWLAGGIDGALYSNGDQGFYSDAWMFNPSTHEWTWEFGTDTINQAGAYGTMGATATTNWPGGRDLNEALVDRSGDVWFFGGNGVDATGAQGYLNDLWKYVP